jgi:hypothetical protein
LKVDYVENEGKYGKYRYCVECGNEIKKNDTGHAEERSRKRGRMLISVCEKFHSGGGIRLGALQDIRRSVTRTATDVVTTLCTCHRLIMRWLHRHRANDPNSFTSAIREHDIWSPAENRTTSIAAHSRQPLPLSINLLQKRA